MRVRVVDFVEILPTNSASRINFASFDVKFGGLNDGMPLVGFEGISELVTLNGQDSGYRLYEFVFDPDVVQSISATELWARE